MRSSSVCRECSCATLARRPTVNIMSFACHNCRSFANHAKHHRMLATAALKPSASYPGLNICTATYIPYAPSSSRPILRRHTAMLCWLLTVSGCAAPSAASNPATALSYSGSAAQRRCRQRRFKCGRVLLQRLAAAINMTEASNGAGLLDIAKIATEHDASHPLRPPLASVQRWQHSDVEGISVFGNSCHMSGRNKAFNTRLRRSCPWRAGSRPCYCSTKGSGGGWRPMPPQRPPSPAGEAQSILRIASCASAGPQGC